MITQRILSRIVSVVGAAVLAGSSVALADKPKPASALFVQPFPMVQAYPSHLESDHTPEAGCARAYLDTGAKTEVACFARTKIETNGFVRKPGNIVCGARSMKEPVAVCLSHHQLKKQFATGIGREICIAWVFDHIEHPPVDRGVRTSMREFNCTQMPTKDTWNGKIVRE